MNEVILLTQADCAWCEKAKTALRRLSDDMVGTVREVDLHTDEGRRLAQAHQVLFAPGVICNDQLVSYGRISERALRRRFARIAATPDPG